MRSQSQKSYPDRLREEFRPRLELVPRIGRTALMYWPMTGSRMLVAEAATEDGLAAAIRLAMRTFEQELLGAASGEELAARIR